MLMLRCLPALLLLCLPLLRAQETVAPVAHTRQVIVVVSHAPALRHVGARHVRYAVDTTAIAAASAGKGAAARKIPSLRFLQIRR
ncbi:MAG: hypothetical protein Q7T30_00980 [Planctomycetota bacterium]|nr:hypothetical protein [Planctomycetota bacterium]